MAFYLISVTFLCDFPKKHMSDKYGTKFILKLTHVHKFYLNVFTQLPFMS